MAGFQTWNEQLLMEPKAMQPIFGGLFKDSEDKIILWSGTDPDSTVNCFTWKADLSTWICANDCFDPDAS